MTATHRHLCGSHLHTTAKRAALCNARAGRHHFHLEELSNTRRSRPVDRAARRVPKSRKRYAARLDRADKELRHPLFTTTVYLYTLILLPLLHSLWLLTGTGNANFFYAATMVHGLNSCLAIVDVLTAGMRLDVKQIPWRDSWTPVQFTGIS